MKGILGRKIGMSQVYADSGQVLPVTIIELKQNVVTKVLTAEADGYVALQLAVGDVKKSRHKKPEVGHFKKAKTEPKRFVREMRGMEGFALGQKVDGSIFSPGEFVDVIGTSKGKGFAGAIKRHNQSIGPKSHGGGGGSKPTRQTGSLGDISGNKVVKGMTMPGQMGNERATVQNLEVIAIDLANDTLLVKGSVPGPKKGYVIVRSAIKLLKSREATKLVDTQEALRKNVLLEEAKKAGANVSTDMSLAEMEAAVSAALAAKKLSEDSQSAEEEVAKLAQEKQKAQAAAVASRDEAKKAEAAGDLSGAKEAKAKAETLEKQIDVVETKAKEANVVAQKADLAAKEAEAKAEELQVVVEEEEEVTKEIKTETKGEAK